MRHPILHKLLHDLFAILVIALAALTVSDIVFPGFLTGFVSFTQLIVALAVVLTAIVATAPDGIIVAQPPLSRRTITVAAILVIALLAVALRPFPLWVVIVILILLGISVFLLLRREK